MNTELTKLYPIRIEGLDDYLINKSGQIWSNKSRKFLKTQLHRGYYKITIMQKHFYVHRLLALTFIPKHESKEELVVNHIDSNKLNNILDNLEWVTQKENVNKSIIGISHPRVVLKYDEEGGTLLEKFNTVTEAGKSIGLTRYAVAKVCVGVNKSAGGFFWKYENEDYKHTIPDLTDAKNIYDYPNYYLFPDGIVYNKQRKSYLKHTGLETNPYVTLCMKGRKKRNYYITRLMKDHFPDVEFKL
jgi:hypothetical protein